MKLITIQSIKDAISIRTWPKYKSITAVLRRGAPPATIIALHLSLPIYVVRFNGEELIVPEYIPEPTLFVDDVVAEGRTYFAVKKIFPEADFLAIVKDYNNHLAVPFLFEEKEWCYFEWEDREKVVNNDRGLFRNKTSVYGEGNAD